MIRDEGWLPVMSHNFLLHLWKVQWWVTLDKSFSILDAQHSLLKCVPFSKMLISSGPRGESMRQSREHCSSALPMAASLPPSGLTRRTASQQVLPLPFATGPGPALLSLRWLSSFLSLLRFLRSTCCCVQLAHLHICPLVFLPAVGFHRRRNLVSSYIP